MKLPRRTFLHLAAGVAVLPALSRIARRGRSASWFRFHRAERSTPSVAHGRKR